MMAILTFLAVIFTIAVGALFLFYKKKFRHWQENGVIHPIPSIPFGNFKGITSEKTIGVLINEIYKQFPNEKFVGFWILFRPILLIRDPELIKSVFVRDFMNFHDRGVYVNEKDDPLAAHLFSISGSKWRNLRVKMTPTFTSGKMKMMFHILTDCSKNLKEVLEVPAANQEVIGVREYVARFSTDIISLCAFGINTDSLHNPDCEFRKFGQKIFDPNIFQIVRQGVQLLVPDLARTLKLTFNEKESAKFFLSAIKETMDYRENNNVRSKDFMDLLVQLKMKGKLDDVDADENSTRDGEKFSFEEAAAQAFVFFVAGFETSSTTMQFVLYELAKNPDIQQRTRNEIKKVLAKHNNELTYDCVMDMEYLARVIDETLRKYPPLSFLQRECNKDYKIPNSNVTIPKGDLVLIDILGLHYDSKYYPNPEKFDPDRFTEEEKAKRNHYTYLPFGEGPRNCIGMRFGLMQTKMGILTLLSNYEFTVSAETLIPMKFDGKSVILQPKGGMYLRIKKLS